MPRPPARSSSAITYHYWSHIGEASAVRQLLGHTRPCPVRRRHRVAGAVPPGGLEQQREVLPATCNLCAMSAAPVCLLGSGHGSPACADRPRDRLHAGSGRLWRRGRRIGRADPIAHRRRHPDPDAAADATFVPSAPPTAPPSATPVADTGVLTPERARGAGGLRQVRRLGPRRRSTWSSPPGSSCSPARDDPAGPRRLGHGRHGRPARHQGRRRDRHRGSVIAGGREFVRLAGQDWVELSGDPTTANPLGAVPLDRWRGSAGHDRRQGVHDRRSTTVGHRRVERRPVGPADLVIETGVMDVWVTADGTPVTPSSGSSARAVARTAADRPLDRRPLRFSDVGKPATIAAPIAPPRAR